MQRRQIDAGFARIDRSQSAFLFEQGNQQVLHIELLLAVLGGQGLSCPQALLQFFCKPIEVHEK